MLQTLLTMLRGVRYVQGMSTATLERIQTQATEVETCRHNLEVEQKLLDKLLAKARREGHSLREIAAFAGVSNVTVNNRTRDAA